MPGATVLEWSVHPVGQGHPLGLRLSLLSQLQTRSGVSIASKEGWYPILPGKNGS